VWPKRRNYSEAESPVMEEKAQPTEEFKAVNRLRGKKPTQERKKKHLVLLVIKSVIKPELCIVAGRYRGHHRFPSCNSWLLLQNLFNSLTVYYSFYIPSFPQHHVSCPFF
jgi:hypothetical protein